LNDNKYAIKNALIYTVLVSAVLLAPLFFYMIHMKSIHSIQNELFLKKKSFLILKHMQDFDQSEEYFEYPRFKTFKSGLYDESFKPVFTLIKSDINEFKSGYYIDGYKAYLITKLPKGIYFDASYLIVMNEISFAPIYEKVFLILFLIVVLVFILSMFFLNSFAMPFKKINQKLDNFIKDSIHEINTPLSIINVNIDLYNRKNEQNKYMQRIKAASKVLSNIYNDMDYLIKHDRVEYEKEDINLSTFLQKRIEYFFEIATIKQINIKSNIEDGIYIYINKKQLGMLIDNNISNAIKYSNENNSIEISLYKQEQFCYIKFKDYGVGIENPKQIFERYYREDTYNGGFGIGLNIVKSIIDEANIELSIDSKLGVGSTFTYKIPL